MYTRADLLETADIWAAKPSSEIGRMHKHEQLARSDNSKSTAFSILGRQTGYLRLSSYNHIKKMSGWNELKRKRHPGVS